MIRGIHHIAISVADINKTLAFYRDVLGFEVVMKGGWKVGTEKADQIIGLKDSEAKFVMLRKGAAHIELFQYHSPSPQPVDATRRICDHGFTHICFEVDDFHKQLEHLRKFKVKLLGEPVEFRPGVWVVYFQGPDGEVCEFRQQPE